MQLEDLELDSSIKTDEDTLDKISKTAQRIQKGQQEVAKLEQKLKEYKKVLRELEEVELPDLMLSIGMKEFKLVSGEQITIKDVVAASISKANQNDAFHWLDVSGHGDLIKNKITLAFSRGEDEKALALCEELQEQGYVPVQAKSVHPQTLSAFVREQLAEGNEIPEDLLGVYVGRKAIIK